MNSSPDDDYAEYDDEDACADNESDHITEEHYSVDDFLIPAFPPAFYIYIRYDDQKDFKIMTRLGTVEAADKISELMAQYDGVEIRVVDVRALN